VFTAAGPAAFFSVMELTIEAELIVTVGKMTLLRLAQSPAVTAARASKAAPDKHKSAVESSKAFRLVLCMMSSPT
jgi:hypothetical protein